MQNRLFVLLWLALGLVVLGCPEQQGNDDDDTTDTSDDQDGDGYTADEDCDDNDATLTPADEDADGYSSCDGDCDDNDATLNLSDDDGDGFSTCDGDCDDLDAALDPADVDGDGYSTCDGDCDDAADAVYPGADEQWFDDVDGDCDGLLDPDACVDPPPESTVLVDDGCIYVPQVGDFSPVVEWSMPAFTEYPDHRNLVGTPLVGQMTDDDSDGDIDGDDIPDVVFVTRDHVTPTLGVIRIVSGDGNAEHLAVISAEFNATTYYPQGYGPVALGDIDQDGSPEIVSTVSDGSDCYVASFDNAGTIEWVYSGHTVTCRSNAGALHDLEGDGDVEVVFGFLILNGADGSLQGAGAGGAGYVPAYAAGGYNSFGADLDGNGIMEVIAGSHVYDPLGAEICDTGYPDGYPAVADLDGDTLGEIVVSGTSYVTLFEHDCTYITQWPVNGGGRGGPPTIADFDGDGQLEIGVAAQYDYTVYETDGTIVWDAPVQDASSNVTGSSVFDFDGNGAAEVVYADEYTLWVYDGATGTVIFQDGYHSSGTVNEYPTIADVDGDGKAEIVMGSDGWYQNAWGIMIFGDANDEWVSARPLWNQQAYYITHVNDDLSIPQNAASNWPTYNNFRQGAPGSNDPQAAVDLYPVAYSACQADCGDDVELLVQVANVGAIRAGDTLTVALYGETAQLDRTLLQSVPLGTPLDPGVLTVPYSFTLTAAEAVAYASYHVVVDDEAASNECDELNNEAAFDMNGACE